MPEESKGVTQQEPEVDLEQFFGMSTGEGEATPRSEPPADKEAKGETAAPEAREPAEETIPKSRFEEVRKRAERADRYAGIIDKLEQDPSLARKLMEPQEVSRSVPPQDQEAEQERVRQYWAKKYDENPVETIAEIAALKTEQASRLNRYRSVSREVRDFRRELQRDDEHFGHYSKHFDDLMKDSDPFVIEQDPEKFLSGARDLAYGRWVREQRSKMKAAGGAKALPREKPEATVSAGAEPKPSGEAKPRRKATEEEVRISQIYGIPLEDIVSDTSETQESPWGRG